MAKAGEQRGPMRVRCVERTNVISFELPRKIPLCGRSRAPVLLAHMPSIEPPWTSAMESEPAVPRRE
jgi:hypothetical protein